MKHRALAVALLLLLAAVPALAGQDVYAIRNCRIVPMSGPVIAKGTIIIRGGLIEVVGPVDKVSPPEDAEIIEAEGLTAYPGLISAHTNIFLDKPQPGQGPGEFPPIIMPSAGAPKEEESKFPPGPGLDVLNILKFKKETADAWRRAGVTTVLAVPADGIFQGRSSILNLNGEDIEAMVLTHGFALHVNFTTDRGKYPSSAMGTIAYIRQSFLDAARYAVWKDKYAKDPSGMQRPPFNSFLEALVPYAVGHAPIVFQCNNREDIGRALKIIAEFKLNGFIAGANEAWRETADLKKAGPPLLVTLDFKAPSSSIYAAQGEEARKKAEATVFPANAAALATEKLAFALTTFGLPDAAAFAKNIQAAVKAGLSRDDALKALTVEPARLLGLDRRLGTLEPGKIADVILTAGEMFEEKTAVRMVFVDGQLFRYGEVSK